MRSVILCLVLVVVTAPAEEYGSDFLTVYPGARQSAMAGAGAALAGTADGVFYNPAGPAFLKSPEVDIEINRIPWAEPTDYWSAAGVVPLLPAINIGVFTSGNHMPLGGEQSMCEWEAGVTASTQASDWLGFGLNLKYVGFREALQQISENGESLGILVIPGRAFAADMGVVARPRTCCGRPSFAIALRNVGTKLKYEYDSTTWAQPLPALLDAGVGWTVTARDLGVESFAFSLPERFFPADWLLESWGASAFYDFRQVSLVDFPTHSVGVEVRPLPFVAARVGWFNSNSSNRNATREGLTWGIGLDLRYVRFDFCEDRNLFYMNLRENYRFSFALNLGEPLLREGGLLQR
jgi:hypothetical protein